MWWQVKAGAVVMFVSLLVPAPTCLAVWLVGVGLVGLGVGLGPDKPLGRTLR